MGRGIDSLPARFPDLVLVRDGAPIPHAPLAQSTDRIGWSELQLAVLCAKASTGEDTVSLPADAVSVACAPGTRWRRLRGTGRSPRGHGQVEDPNPRLVRLPAIPYRRQENHPERWRSDQWVDCTYHRYCTRRMRGRSRSRTGIGRSGIGSRSLSVGGFGLFCAGYDGNRASTPRNGYVTTYPSGISIRREKAWV